MAGHDFWSMAAAAAAGLAAGALSFSGLWWSVRRTSGRRAPGVPLAAGSALRFALLAAVFWFAARGDSARLLAVLAGFLVSQAGAVALGMAGVRSARAGRGEDG
jgi:F1F0 ATPase subunit 2